MRFDDALRGVKRLVVFSTLLFWILAHPFSVYAGEQDNPACPFAPDIESKIAGIGPMKFKYCEGFGRNSYYREVLSEESELYLSSIETIEEEIEKRTGKLFRILYIYNEKSNKNLDNTRRQMRVILSLDPDTDPDMTVLKDASMRSAVVRVSNRPKRYTHYYYFQEDGDLATADTIVSCNMLSDEPLLPTSQFKRRGNGEPVYRHCYFRIRYQDTVMIDADFYDVMWNELADIRDSLTDTLDQLVVR